MGYEFNAHEIAQEFLLDMGINFDSVYNDEGGIIRAQLTIISQISAALGTYTDQAGKETTLKQNAYKTIDRLNKSANKKDIDFNANLFNTLVGTVATVLTERIETETTSKQKKETMIKWLPSSANEQDEFHALQYGKVMTLESALQKGNGTRYGCQCGMEFLNDDAGQKVDNFISLTVN